MVLFLFARLVGEANKLPPSEDLAAGLTFRGIG